MPIPSAWRSAVSIGGDAMIGSTYAELMPLFDADPETKGIAIYSEPGGRAEYELADYMAASGSKLPVVAFMAGRFMDEMPGMRFGHAGTIVEGTTKGDNEVALKAWEDLERLGPDMWTHHHARLVTPAARRGAGTWGFACVTGRF